VSVVVVVVALQKPFNLLQKSEKIQLIPHIPKKPILSLPRNNNPFIPIVPPPPPPPPTTPPPAFPPPPFLSFSFLLNHLTPLYYTTTPPHNLSSPQKKPTNHARSHPPHPHPHRPIPHHLYYLDFAARAGVRHKRVFASGDGVLDRDGVDTVEGD